MKKSYLLAAASTALFSATTLSARSGSAPLPRDAAEGRTIFVSKGCYACHGYNGQGSLTGPKLAPDPPGAAALETIVRNGGPTLMPAYSKAQLSDAELALIGAWLSAQPRTPSFNDLPLLSDQTNKRGSRIK